MEIRAGMPIQQQVEFADDDLAVIGHALAVQLFGTAFFTDWA
ncbi:hypothetical protein [Nitrosococcus wardiae]|nr:hypothetical protein [Nitrosococcus wardiae]